MQHTGNERLVWDPFFGCTGLNIHQIGRRQPHIDPAVLDQRRPGRLFKTFKIGLGRSHRLKLAVLVVSGELFFICVSTFFHLRTTFQVVTGCLPIRNDRFEEIVVSFFNKRKQVGILLNRDNKHSLRGYLLGVEWATTSSNPSASMASTISSKEMFRSTFKRSLFSWLQRNGFMGKSKQMCALCHHSKKIYIVMCILNHNDCGERILVLVADLLALPVN